MNSTGNVDFKNTNIDFENLKIFSFENKIENEIKLRRDKNELKNKNSKEEKPKKPLIIRSSKSGIY